MEGGDAGGTGIRGERVRRRQEDAFFDILRHCGYYFSGNYANYRKKVVSLQPEPIKHIRVMEATTTTAPKKRISRTARWARAHKWVIEVVDPELQKQCKSYKDGQKIIRP